MSDNKRNDNVIRVQFRELNGWEYFLSIARRFFDVPHKWEMDKARCEKLYCCCELLKEYFEKNGPNVQVSWEINEDFKNSGSINMISKFPIIFDKEGINLISEIMKSACDIGASRTDNGMVEVGFSFDKLATIIE